MFGVRPEKEKELLDLMKKLCLKEEDLEEKFVRAGGKGGQKLNKTSSCVHLKHLPTGLVVKVQRERSQNLNRFLARRRLAEKYLKEVLGQSAFQDKKRDKIRKQKQRRKRRCQKKSEKK